MKFIFTLGRWHWIGFLLFPYLGMAQTFLKSYSYVNGGVGVYGGVTINNLYYYIINGTNNQELWKTDGTAANTNIAINFSPNISVHTPFYKVANDFYFLATLSPIGTELWKSTGTPITDATSIKDIKPGMESGFYDQYGFLFFNPRTVNGIVLFVADNGTNGTELWRTDGTNAGTYMVKDIYPGSTGSGLALDNGNSLQVGNIVYFGANEATGRGLWRTDGTSAGTYRLTDNYRGGIVNANGTLYFIKQTAPGQGLWKSDGTVAGTQFVTNTGLNYASQIGENVYAASDNLIFYTGRGPNTITFPQPRTAVFKSDGTAGGSQLVLDNLLGISSVNIVNGKLMFYTPGTSSSSGGFRLWSSDGTVQGSGMYKEHYINNTNESFPFTSYLLNNRYVYVWRDPNISGNGLATWITDGTVSGTYSLKDQTVDNSPFWAGQAFFINNKYFMLVNGEVWSSDGTTASTAQISQFRTLFGESRIASDMTPFNSMLLLTNYAKELFSLSTCILPFTLSASTSDIVCPGTSVTLSSTNCTGTLSWSTGATGSSINVSPSTTTTYTATCTDNGCSSDKTITVSVVPSSVALTGTAVTGTNKSTQTLTSTQTIPLGTAVSYQAGASVTMQPNFQAQAGSLFQAEIKTCN